MVPVIKEVPSLLHWPFLTQDFTSGPHSQLYTKNPLNIASDPLSTKNSSYVPNFSEIFNVSTTWYSLGLHFLPCLSLSCNKSYIFPPKLPALSTDPQILYSYQQYNSFGTRVSDRELLSFWPSHQVLEQIKPQNKKSFLSPRPISTLDPRHPPPLSLVWQPPCYPGSISIITFFSSATSNVLLVFSKKFFREFFIFFAFPAISTTTKFLSLSLLHCCSSLFHEIATASSFISMFTPIQTAVLLKLKPRLKYILVFILSVLLYVPHSPAKISYLICSPSLSMPLFMVYFLHVKYFCPSKYYCLKISEFN